MATNPNRAGRAPSAHDAVFQRRLARWNRERMAPAMPGGDWEAAIDREAAMRLEEGRWLESERAALAPLLADLPTDAQGFVQWFEVLKETGAGQGDPLFPWLAEHATLDQLRWFLTQEAAGEAGFDDLVALTQLKLPDRPKLELARNYWDEMGRGNINGMHGRLLVALTERLEITPTIDDTVPESLALANTMLGLAANRRYAWHSVGALGVVELTAPGRVAQVAQGLRRLGFTDRERRYFDLHAVLDVKHSEDWNREALIPLVEEDPRRARPIAEGALMRLEAGKRCFGRYRAHLWGPRG
jgi:hypothetical protein